MMGASRSTAPSSSVCVAGKCEWGVVTVLGTTDPHASELRRAGAIRAGAVYFVPVFLPGEFLLHEQRILGKPQVDIMSIKAREW